MDKFAAAAESWQMLSGFLQAAQMIPQVQRAPAGSLPLTVIGGFLGAGKTTLLNQLLVQPHGRRIAVLVNDFGRINIDAALIRSQTEDMISLANGCACCSVAGDLTRTLIELAQRAEPPDAIVLEASGLADPIGIAQIALANPSLRLDGILAVVDAEAAVRLGIDADCAATFRSQIAAADLVILNKADLVGLDVLAAAHSLVASLAPGKPVVRASNAEVPDEILLGIRTERSLPSLAASPSNHASAFRSWSATTNAVLDSERFRAMMRGLPAGVLRAKGILRLSDAPGRSTVFQQVGKRSSYAVQGPSEKATTSTLVIIGTVDAINDSTLTLAFEACRASL